jgi:hypothetical protein
MSDLERKIDELTATVNELRELIMQQGLPGALHQQSDAVTAAVIGGLPALREHGARERRRRKAAEQQQRRGKQA